MEGKKRAVQRQQEEEEKEKREVSSEALFEMKRTLEGVYRENLKRELENTKLKSEVEYERKLRDIERGYAEKVAIAKTETKKALEVTLENMKQTYEAEIRVVKQGKKKLEDSIDDLKRENIKKEGDVSEEGMSMRYLFLSFLCRLHYCRRRLGQGNERRHLK